jgi:hypothetical protein
MEVQEKLYACQNRVTSVLDDVASTADSAKKSINKWDRKMRKVQWVQIGSARSIGLFLGALMYWWVVAPQGSHPRQELVDTTAQHAVAASGKTSQRITNAGRPERARVSGTASEGKPKR